MHGVVIPSPLDPFVMTSSWESESVHPGIWILPHGTILYPSQPALLSFIL